MWQEDHRKGIIGSMGMVGRGGSWLVRLSDFPDCSEVECRLVGRNTPKPLEPSKHSQPARVDTREEQRAGTEQGSWAYRDHHQAQGLQQCSLHHSQRILGWHITENTTNQHLIYFKNSIIALSGYDKFTDMQKYSSKCVIGSSHVGTRRLCGLTQGVNWQSDTSQPASYAGPVQSRRHLIFNLSTYWAFDLQLE